MLRPFIYCLVIIFLVAKPMTNANGSGQEDLLPMPQVGEDGLHTQDWFHESFLDLSEDLQEAQEQGKRLVIFWEQRGCPYCKRAHEINFRIPTMVQYIEKNFMVLQLNLWGDREVTDFDGEKLSEKKLAEKYAILFTPTLQFFPENLEKVAGQKGSDAEVVRIPGYFKPFHFYFLFHYAFDKGYEKQPSFQRWLSNIGRELDEMGVEYDLDVDALPKDLPKKYL
jgi:thioredoxin-related protein